ncbi:hypothetical protein G9A89_002491 [Geosiphon pyriformis]|nr:hypothetical protein G9A89_002491 [Geosiphon pyriformis]
MPKVAKTATAKMPRAATTTKAKRQVADTKVVRETRSKKSSTTLGEKGPKRGLSSYMFFVKEQRETVKNEHPEADFKEVSKLVAEKWKQLSDKEKEPYKQMAAADKQRYESEKAANADNGTRMKSEETISDDE